ncbi:MAG: hypothetical protein ABJL67_19010 [Sulfitobacter sp.]
MKNSDDLPRLLEISQTRYDQQRQAFALIVQEENRLRAELEKLKGLDQVGSSDPHEMIKMKSLGADVLWQSWLARSRTTLNIQLARTLALKAHEQDKVRHVFGKVTALESLIATNMASRQKKARQAIIGRAIDHALFEKSSNAQ